MTTTNCAEVGTILASTWGYEQTNVDFYEVIKATAKTVVLRQIRASRVDADAFMTYAAAPVPGDFIGEPFRRTIHGGRTDGITVSINSYAIASTWDGRAVCGSSYA